MQKAYFFDLLKVVCFMKKIKRKYLKSIKQRAFRNFNDKLAPFFLEDEPFFKEAFCMENYCK